MSDVDDVGLDVADDPGGNYVPVNPPPSLVLEQRSSRPTLVISLIIVAVLAFSAHGAVLAITNKVAGEKAEEWQQQRDDISAASPSPNAQYFLTKYGAPETGPLLVKIQGRDPQSANLLVEVMIGEVGYHIAVPYDRLVTTPAVSSPQLTLNDEPVGAPSTTWTCEPGDDGFWVYAGGDPVCTSHDPAWMTTGTWYDGDERTQIVELLRLSLDGNAVLEVPPALG